MSKFRVWWIPQVPGESITFEVDSPREAKLLLDVLARYDEFQLEEGIKPDYSNAGGFQVLEDGEWLEWLCPDCDDDIDRCECP